MGRRWCVTPIRIAPACTRCRSTRSAREFLFATQVNTEESRLDPLSDEQLKSLGAGTEVIHWAPGPKCGGHWHGKEVAVSFGRCWRCWRWGWHAAKQYLRGGSAPQNECCLDAPHWADSADLQRVSSMSIRFRNGEALGWLVFSGCSSERLFGGLTQDRRPTGRCRRHAGGCWRGSAWSCSG